MSLAERVQEPDLVDLPDWRVAEILNAPDPALPTYNCNISTSDVRGVFLTTGEWPRIVLLSEGRKITADEVPVELQGLCILVRDTLKETHTIETSNPQRYLTTIAAITGLLQAGVIAQGTYDVLVDLPVVHKSWAQHNEIEVTARTVGLARGGR